MIDEKREKRRLRKIKKEAQLKLNIKLLGKQRENNLPKETQVKL